MVWLIDWSLDRLIGWMVNWLVDGLNDCVAGSLNVWSCDRFDWYKTENDW